MKRMYMNKDANINKCSFHHFKIVVVINTISTKHTTHVHRALCCLKRNIRDIEDKTNNIFILMSSL